jgi:Holliday junction resolvase
MMLLGIARIDDRMGKMSGPETRIQQNIQKAVRARGGYILKIHGSDMMPSGTPDLIMCYKGCFVAMEVKTPQTHDNVSPVQRLRLDQIEAAGGGAYVVWDVDMAMKVLDVIDAALSTLDDAINSVSRDDAKKVLARWQRSTDQ